MAMFRHVRWLYNLIRVANAAAVFDGFLLGSHQQEPFRQSQRGFLAWWFLDYLLLEIWSYRREGQANTQTSRCAYHLVASLGKIFSERFPERSCPGSEAWVSRVPSQTINS